jgi:16S rRNA processing protein RimM
VNHAAGRPSVRQQQGSGAQFGVSEPLYLAIGRINGAHGIRGELKVKVLTADAHRFDGLNRVYLGRDEDNEPVPRSLLGYRVHKGRALLRLEGIEDRSVAEALKGYLVQIPFEEVPPLEEDEYFEHQILGLEVWTTSGEFLGCVSEILYTGANEVYVVNDPTQDRRDTLIPAIAEVVQQVDLAAGRLVVQLLEGLR